MMERLALFLAAEPLQALTPALIQGIAPEIAAACAYHCAPAALPAVQQEAALPDILAILQRCGGNRAAAARQLGISRTTLWRKLKEGGAAGQ